MTVRKWYVKLSAVALAGVLSLSALPARAAGYADLDQSHWAYYDMTRAVNLGILQGVGNNQLAPALTMSWGQFLALVTRTFAPDAYQDALSQGAAWDEAGYLAALSAGILRSEDALAVGADRLGEGITREDAAVLLYRSLPEALQEKYAEQSQSPELEVPFTDFDQMDSVHQAAVYALSVSGVSSGKPDGSFGRTDLIQRCDGTALLMRTLGVVDRARTGDVITIMVHGVDSESGQELFSQQYTTEVGAYLYGMQEDAPQYYVFDGFREGSSVSSACTSYYALYRPMTQTERAEADFWDKVDQGLASAEDYWNQPFWLTALGENQAKRNLLFGSADKRRFDTLAEAQGAMTTVTVPIWRLSNGVKKASTATLQVHAAIADDVVAIFTEIYNDPEQFPINAMGGFRYVEGTTGEHNCGTAIDLNANENYQIRDGKILVGSCWEPGSNPYSIGPDSSVVRIFEAHGWSWGGDAWAGDSDDATGYHDYMHFSYMGG